jgi:hypothetical protein
MLTTLIHNIKLTFWVTNNNNFAKIFNIIIENETKKYSNAIINLV